MSRLIRIGTIGAALAGLVAGVGQAPAQQVEEAQPQQPEHVTRNVVIPQRGVIVRPGEPERIQISGVRAHAEINDQVSTTNLEIALHNPSSRQMEAELMVPVPVGVTVRSFGYEGVGEEPGGAELLPRDEARRTYEDIVRTMRDPGLLEFAGYNMIRSRVFPVPANSTQKVWITYEQLLNSDAGRIDFSLPRSQSLAAGATTWKLSANIHSSRNIATVYSPSHEIRTIAKGPGFVTVEVPEAATREPGPFRLSILPEGGEVPASLIAFPDEEIGGGYFLLLAGAPEADRNAERVKREVTIVIDRSGSMRGEKIEQARAAALQVLDGIEMGEWFNIIDYSDSVARFSEGPVIKDERTIAEARAYVSGLVAEGGTDIHTALGEAVSQAPADGTLPMIIFLTDGLPTVGNTSEVDIRENTASANTHKRRIFTFGVGYDVNAPLLDRIALTTRAASINVLPGENIEVAVTTVFRRLAGPVLAWPELAARGEDAIRRLRDLQPIELPDLFEGDQLVVFGQYRGDKPLQLRLTGEYRGRERTFDYEFSVEEASKANGYIPRLWASRRIANLVDEIRQLGASTDPIAGRDDTPDPRMKELVDGIVALSSRWGILTEYTAFLAREPAEGGVALDLELANDEAMRNLEQRAMDQRSGQAGVNQAVNLKRQQALSSNNAYNAWTDDDGNQIEITTCQQVNDQTLFRRDNRWCDSRIMLTPDQEVPEPDRTVEFGTDEYFELAELLAKDGRALLIAMSGEVFIRVGDENVLVKNPEDGC